MKLTVQFLARWADQGVHHYMNVSLDQDSFWDLAGVTFQKPGQCMDLPSCMHISIVDCCVFDCRAQQVVSKAVCQPHCVGVGIGGIRIVQ